MRRLVLLSMIATAFPFSALAGPCPSSDKSPCLPDEATINILLEKIEMLEGRNNEIRSAEIVWRFAKDGENKADELSKFEAYKKAKNEFNRESAELVDLIQKAYHVAPPRTSGAAHKPMGANGTMDWMDGIPVLWKPRITMNNDDYRLIKTKKAVHYASVNTAAYAGATLPNGDVVIASSLLRDALTDRNPGVIAQAIYHEGRHFTSLITTGWRSVEQDEVDAYSAVKGHDDVFKLSEGWLRRNASELASNQEALKTGSERAFVITPEEEKTIKGIIDHQKGAEVDSLSIMWSSRSRSLSTPRIAFTTTA